MSIKLIASDIDGTLLPFGSNEIPKRSIDAIQKVIDRGIRFILASGRQYHQMRRFFSSVADEIDYIAENGCLAYHNGKLIYRAAMSEDLSREILETVLKIENCEIVVSGEKSYYMNPRKMDLFEHIRDVDHAKITRVDSLFELPEPCMKISIFNDNRSADDLAYWRDRLSSKCTVQTSGHNLIDIVPPNVNKATALKKILETLNISPKDVIAFGDNENDREMLELVGCPIVMKISNPAIQSIGKFVTDNVAISLEKFLEGELKC
ncbi:MAG: HAD family hydrolase [Selenomonadaceae bacterium]|nr:HAD family hydrolase [Selenomonadaceae bacterium]